MKNSLYASFIFAMTLFGCSSQKKLETNAPIAIGSATCQQWIGGMEQSGSGYVLTIPITAQLPDGFSFREVYFRGNKAKVEIEEMDNDIQAVAKFQIRSTDKPDIIMHADPREEAGNQPPPRNIKIPFELNRDEAVLSYMENNKEKYFKITGIKEKAPKIYPTKPKN